MRLKKLVCFGLILAMITSLAGCGGEGPEGTSGTGSGKNAAPAEISEKDVSVTWKDSRIYPQLTLGQYRTISTYGVKGYEDVPFMMVSDYLDILFDGRQKVTVEDGVMKIDVNGTEAVIDPGTDTITVENPSRFRSNDFVDGAIVTEPEFNVITPSSKNESLQTDVKPVKIALKDYHMPVIPYEDGIIMPFLALQNSLGAIMMNTCLAYNGKDYYNAFMADQFTSEEGNEAAKDSPYIRAIYSGPFSEKNKTSQAYADYGYYSTCLLLDLTFGHKKEKNIQSFDEYFTRLSAKDTMCSTNPSAAATAEFVLFNYLFDSGHDGVFNTDSVFGKLQKVDKKDVEEIVDDIKESDQGKELFEEEQKAEEEPDLPLELILGALFEKGLKIPEVAPLYAWSFYYEAARPEDYGNLRLDYVDDTAVIYFRSFVENPFRDPSFYLDPLKKEDEEDSNFAFFYNCFKDIKKHKKVKNVVINICDNGGGNVAGLVSILGFLSKDGEVRFTDMDMVAGNYREEFYHVDTNLDGADDDKDGFGGQYDFYIMCSGESYSCANALPYFAQKDGLAKIIGTKPGGGDCVVGYFIDAYGRCAFYSSFLKMGRQEGKKFVSDEKDTTVDYNMMPSITDIDSVPWFDAKGITEAVHQYKSGKKQAVYGDDKDEKTDDKEDELDIDDFLSLFD